ncbi:hypothetical protein ROS9278_05063 [Roseomonas sp. CECT 9278]|nr:hypothetical protein ROS9278_05063 [Roseomonas sp. CECT 9278]
MGGRAVATVPQRLASSAPGAAASRQGWPGRRRVRELAFAAAAGYPGGKVNPGEIEP